MDERVRRTVETYESIADTYVERHGDRDAVAGLVRQFLEAVEATASDGSEDPARVLDVGPGPGWETATFDDHGLDAVAVDVTRSFLEQTRERVPEADLVGGDMRALPFAEDTFDGLWACASLLHVPREDVPATLSEYERVLAPGGVTVVSIQRRRGGGDTEDADGDTEDADGDEKPRNPYDEDSRHFEQYAPTEIRAAFERAGFAVDSVDPDGDWVAVEARAE
jgi:ubiquinone/menaquinone biosynthesis C-methylase UbiE